MEARLSGERQFESWDPALELQSADNQAYFAEILPQLQTVQLVKAGATTIVIERNHGHEVSSVDSQLAGQTKWLGTHAALHAFAPQEVAVNKDEVPEEALARSLHLSLLQGTLEAASRGTVSFEAANQDIILLLGSLKRPTHRYRHLSHAPQPFMAQYYEVARSSREFSRDQLKSCAHITAGAVCQAVVDPPMLVRKIAGKTIVARPVPHVLRSQNAEPANNPSEPKPNNTAKKEINFPTSPRLKAFLRELGCGENQWLNTAKETIAQADVAESILSKPSFTKELWGRLGIAAYLETLARDAEQQEVGGSVNNALAFITKTEYGATDRIIQLANQVSQMARQALEATDNSEELPLKSGQFLQMEVSPANLPRAFSVLRLVMTQLGKNKVIESPSTKQLGNVVESVLTTAYPR